MRLPIPKNRLVALTLVGALLTTVVAAGLAAPGVLSNDDTQTVENAAGLSGDAPTPNENFTPAVSTSSGGGNGEHEEGEHEEYEEEEHEEYD
ncbi:MAG: hypothetical protein ABEJ22_03140 [Haloferacaceae archaeon]